MNKTVELQCEVTSITPEGINLLLSEDGNEASEDTQYFVPFDHYTQFAGATIEKIWNVKVLPENIIAWPDLGIEIETEILENPQRFYLKYT